MAVNLSPVGGVAAQFFTSTGAVLTGGKLYTYAAGTTTPATTYTTSQGNVAWSNPIVLDAAGRVPGSGEIWLTDGIIYKFVLKDSNDVLIATYDNITGINSNAVAYTNQQEIVTATAGQTVFNLGISYQPGTNSLSVFVDGVNQYGPGAQYSYVETDSTTVTFNAGLHVGAEVKFTTTQQQGAGAVDASQVTYDPPFTGSVATNVEAKLAQTVSVKDFGAVGDGVTDDTAAIQAAIDAVAAAGGGVVYIPLSSGSYRVDLTYQTPTSNDYHTIALWLKDNVTINATGATIEALLNNTTHGGFVSYAGRSNAHVIGGTWIGDKALHSPLPAGEFCFAFVMSASFSCTIKNAIIKDSRGDGVYVGGTPNVTWSAADISYDTEISGNQIINCGRNGISIVGAQRYVIADNIITGTYGYAPQAGIDVEPNHSYAGNWGSVDGVITGNVVTENYGDGITLFRSSGLTVSGNTVSRNGERGISLRGDVYDTVVSGNAVKYAGLRAAANADAWYGLYMDALAGGYGNVLITGNTVDSAKCFNVVSDAGSKITVSGNSFAVSASAANLWGAQGTGTADTNSYFTSYIIAVDNDGTTFTDNQYRVDASLATWRGASSFFVGIRRSVVANNTFYNVNSTGGINIRLDDTSATPYQFHYNSCNNNLAVGQLAIGFWSAVAVDFSRSVLNGNKPTAIFVKTNSPALGWVMPDVVGNSYEFAYGVDPGSGTTYRFKIWDGAVYRYAAAFV